MTLFKNARVMTQEALMRGFNVTMKILLGVALGTQGLRLFTYYPQAFNTAWQLALGELLVVTAFIVLLVIGIRWSNKRLRYGWLDF
jgi:membrane protein YdbS with pleckstrin-like domain